jgi:hypothetical protein
MKTVVQLRSDPALTCELAHGSPDGFVQGERGPIAIVGPDRILAYVIRASASPTLFVFRTLTVDDRLAASVPGVFPRVRLLIHVRSAGRVRAARRLFAYLVKRGIEPSLLPDAFFVRMNVALAGRCVNQTRLRVLLRRELEGPPVAERVASPGRS